MVVYILLGAVGVPVFSMGRAGFSVLVSPSGGFIVSWIAVSALIGWICEKYGKKFWTVAGGYGGRQSVVLCGRCFMGDCIDRHGGVGCAWGLYVSFPSGGYS